MKRPKQSMIVSRADLDNNNKVSTTTVVHRIGCLRTSVGVPVYRTSTVQQ